MTETIINTEKKPQALIEIRCSKLLPGQISLFAVRNLKKGTIIGLSDRLGEKLYSWDVYDKLDKQTRKIIDKYCASSEEGFWGPDDINRQRHCHVIGRSACTQIFRNIHSL
jgi:hypothetical protein